jgi:hypothetical protein
MKAYNIRDALFECVLVVCFKENQRRHFCFQYFCENIILILKYLQGAYCSVQITLPVTVKLLRNPGCDSVNSFVKPSTTFTLHLGNFYSVSSERWTLDTIYQ